MVPHPPRYPLAHVNTLLLINPLSGVEQGRAFGEAVCKALQEAGHAVDVHFTNAARDNAALGLAARTSDVLIVVGGDGTMSRASTVAIDAGIPVFHVPLGTESLFARHWSMKRDAAGVARAIRAWRVVKTDVGVCNERTFLLMCSAGPDASITARVDANRRAAGRASGHAMYVSPILHELIAPAIPCVSVWVDGVRVVDDERGIVVAGNSPQYGMRLDPARNADPHDGLLDVVFMPARTGWGVLGWAMDCLRGTHIADPRCVYRRGERVRLHVRCRSQCVQADGEPVRVATPECALNLSVRPGVLKVLLPAM